MTSLDRIVTPLLGWYSAHARNLPWRTNATPYSVWVSEVMLQQTRIGAVLGHYARFMAALPDIASLAAVDEAALLKLWEGLGYYSRVRNLQKAARQVIELYSGELPASCALLRELPGFGDYTAAAVASIVFGEAVPAVDGNVLRVVSRIEADARDIAAQSTKGYWRERLTDIIPHDRPGAFNEALMELGETLCLPNTAPLCGECPLRELCLANERGLQRELPVKSPKAARTAERRTVALVAAGDRLLLFRRPSSGLLAGLYEPLNLAGELDEDQMAKEFAVHGGKPISFTPLGEATHIFTHREWHMRGWFVRCEPFDAPPNGVWASRDELRGVYAVPSAFRGFMKDLDQLLDG